MAASPRSRGFTLIELMVTVAVIVIVMLLAIPSFLAFRQRAATRAAAESVTSFWNQARMDAAKRNQMVKVNIVRSGSNFCLGSTTTTDPADSTACNCFSANACTIATYPGDPTNGQGEWNEVTVSGTPTLGTNTGVVVIEPKRTALTASTMAGSLSLISSGTSKRYKLNVLIDQFGRAVVCESTSAQAKMSDFSDRRCAP
jgi:prepilin-type N-terminal cleavage/methylation domain-containing protein